MSVLMTAYSFRTVACAPTRIHTIRCWSVFRGTVDVLPPRVAGTSLKFVASWSEYKWCWSNDHARFDSCAGVHQQLVPCNLMRAAFALPLRCHARYMLNAAYSHLKPATCYAQLRNVAITEVQSSWSTTCVG